MKNLKTIALAALFSSPLVASTSQATEDTLLFRPIGTLGAAQTTDAAKKSAQSARTGYRDVYKVTGQSGTLKTACRGASAKEQEETAEMLELGEGLGDSADLATNDTGDVDIESGGEENVIYGSTGTSGTTDMSASSWTGFAASVSGGSSATALTASASQPIAKKGRSVNYKDVYQVTGRDADATSAARGATATEQADVADVLGDDEE